MDDLGSPDALGDLYQELILDHNARPRNFGLLPEATHRAVGHNPMCGDRLELALALGADGHIADIRFTGEGCAISRASASLMTLAVKSLGHGEAERLFARVHALLTGAEATSPPAATGADEGPMRKLRALAGVRAFPARVKCASLAWHTLIAALAGGGAVAKTEA